MALPAFPLPSDIQLGWKEASVRGGYHYIVEAGYRGNWYDPVCNYTYNGTGPSWIITEDNGMHFMESMRIEKNKPHRMYPTLETGEHFWKNYRVSVKQQRLSRKGAVDCFVDDDLLMHVESQEMESQEILRIAVRGGKVGITADCPTRFTDFSVSVSEKTEREIASARLAAQTTEMNEVAKHPAMKLWKKIDLGKFGASRQIRFGHLLGGDEWFIVLAQMQRRVSRDAYGFISCLTAVNLDGQILWQLEEPSENTAWLGKVSADMAFQVYDIDGDGQDEVIVGRNFEIQILDGRSGAVKRSVKTPLSDDGDEGLIGVPFQIYAFDRINPDGIRICNFRGKCRPADILIKDRYCRVYALDEELNLLWKYKSPKNTGHCPMPVDINGDGRDELLVGYTMLDADGKELWTYPIQDDHTDEIVAGKFRGDGRGYFACVSGTEGFFIGDFYGNIVTRDRIGHAQRVSVANYCGDMPGFEIAVSNFWGHQGVIYLYDADGNELWEMEDEMNGNILSPVNWDGNGVELILLNGDAKKGGLINGDGIRAVAFPDDGHPTLCCEAVDLTGDGRDELVVWDYNEMYIYTQEDNPKPQTYHPVKFPVYNASNYRGEYAFPDESYIRFEKNLNQEILKNEYTK